MLSRASRTKTDRRRKRRRSRTRGAGHHDLTGAVRARSASKWTFVDGASAEREADHFGAELAPRLHGVRPGSLAPAELDAAHDVLGVDLTGTELRTDAAATAKADRFDARAVTEGEQVSISRDEFSPATSEGRALIGHELTHAAQQRRAGVRTPQAASRCDPEGPRREVDPDNPQLPPLVYKTGDPGLLKRRAIRPTVGYAQQLLNVFLDRLALGRVGCVPDMDQTAFAKFHERLENPAEIEVDCFFWTETDAATRMFQLCDGLEPDGRIGPLTWAALESFATTPPEPPDLELPPVETPEEPIGPIKGPDAPEGFCEPFTNRTAAELAHSFVLNASMAFTSKFGATVRDFWRQYLTTPKVGTRGTLAPRRLFDDPSSRVVRAFQIDPETTEHTNEIMGLLVTGIRNDPTLQPREGEFIGPLPLRRAGLQSSDLLDRPMQFEDPFNRIPGLLAGGFAKNASDAGDDVRHVDGRFTVLGIGGAIRVNAFFTFDVQDAIDFCPGAPGSLIAQLLLTRLTSQLEATPDMPVYDTPFEVIFNTAREQDL